MTRSVEELQEISLVLLQEIAESSEESAKEELNKIWRYVYGKAGSNGDDSQVPNPEQKALLREQFVNLVLKEDQESLKQAISGKEQQDSAEFLLKFLYKFTSPNIISVSAIKFKDSNDEEKISEKQEQELKPVIPITSQKKFSELLQDFHKEEEINGDEQFERNDGIKVDATKTLSLKVVTDNAELFFSLKRFGVEIKKESGSKDLFQASKEQTKVDLDPIELDVFGSSEVKKKQQYEPTAFIIHDGDNINSGHYRAFIKEIDQEGNVGWFEYDDSSQKKVEECELENGLPKCAKNAYVVKYSPLADGIDDPLIGADRYKSGLPQSQKSGIINNGGNHCFINAAFIFFLSITELKPELQGSKSLPVLDSFLESIVIDNRDFEQDSEMDKISTTAVIDLTLENDEEDKKIDEQKLNLEEEGKLGEILKKLQEVWNSETDKKNGLKNLLEIIFGLEDKQLKQIDDCLRTKSSLESFNLENLLNREVKSFLDYHSNQEGAEEKKQNIQNISSFFAEIANREASLIIINEIRKSEENQKLFRQEPQSFIAEKIDQTELKKVECSEEEKNQKNLESLAEIMSRPFQSDPKKRGQNGGSKEQKSGRHKKGKIVPDNSIPKNSQSVKNFGDIKLPPKPLTMEETEKLFRTPEQKKSKTSAVNSMAIRNRPTPSPSISKQTSCPLFDCLAGIKRAIFPSPSSSSR